MGTGQPVRYETDLRAGEGTGLADPRQMRPPEPPEKPPTFIDRNLKAGRLVLREGAREAVVEFIKWLLLGRKRQPAG